MPFSVHLGACGSTGAMEMFDVLKKILPSPRDFMSFNFEMPGARNILVDYRNMQLLVCLNLCTIRDAHMCLKVSLLEGNRISIAVEDLEDTNSFFPLSMRPLVFPIVITIISRALLPC